jgi:hypothetical protein
MQEELNKNSEASPKNIEGPNKENIEKSPGEVKQEKITNLGTRLDELVGKIAFAERKLQELPAGEGDSEIIEEIEGLKALLVEEEKISEKTISNVGVEVAVAEEILPIEDQEKVKKLNKGFALLEKEFQNIFPNFVDVIKYEHGRIDENKEKLKEVDLILEILKKNPKLDSALLFNSDQANGIVEIEKVRKFIEDNLGKKEGFYRISGAISDLKEKKIKIMGDIDWNREDIKTFIENHAEPYMDKISESSSKIYGEFGKLAGPERQKLVERMNKLDEGIDKFEEMRQEALKW